MRPAPFALAAALLVAPVVLRAQDEQALRDAFEGRTVTVRIDTPGTDDGVDLHPGTDRPLDFAKLASRLKQNGTAIQAGDRSMVTKVKVKSKLIEFQLGGGGFGTFGDDASTSTSVGATPKSDREKALEKGVRSEPDPVRRRAMQSELDDLRAAREAEDRRNAAALAAANEAKKANVRQRRLEGGSRFNLRFDHGIPPEALTPDAVRAALARYVEFTDDAPVAAGTPTVADPAPAPRTIRKGLLVAEVDSLYGPPARTADRKEGSLKVTTRTYAAAGQRVTAEFVEGVLVRFTIASE
jgi:hypothetical protein